MHRSSSKPYGESRDTSWCISCAFRGHIWTWFSLLPRWWITCYLAGTGTLAPGHTQNTHICSNSMHGHIWANIQLPPFAPFLTLPCSPYNKSLSFFFIFIYIFLFKLNLKTFLGRACIRRFKVQLWTLILVHQFTDSADYKSFNCEL